ncbi:MAG: bifunctional precorrin-2 dehydrogenase/sirohydrochlorin ferrochelatase [Candidatus Tectomicrobia bacterium]|nr:bifunctional precorrin-2 dehydrogenase/sirohydrochlorin ferrochelatase [Candidatus Tectomicrobia bacterium]
MRPYFQANLDVANRLCLVIGGAEEATDKTKKLLLAQASVTIVSPTLTDELKIIVKESHVTYHARRFKPSDTDGVFLVMNTIKTDPDLSQEIYRLSQEKRFLLSSYDQPDYSDITMASLVSRGLLRIAISTSGASPALAKRIREDFESLFDDEFVEFLDWLSRLRDELAETIPDQKTRSEKLIEAVSQFRIVGKAEYPEYWKGVRESR